jgi:competence protein CoiA
MDPINETHVREPGLFVVDVAPAADATAQALQQLLADRWATTTAEQTPRDAGQPGVRLRCYLDLCPVRLERPDGEQHLVIGEGLVKFDAGGWKPVPASLTEFLAWAFARRIVPHTPRTPQSYPQRPLATVWTAPHYSMAETAHLEEEERQRRIREARQAAQQREKEKKREKIRARNAVSRAQALAEATTAEQAARTRPPSRLWQVARVFRRGVDQALAKLADEHGITATVGFSTGEKPLSFRM